jgi:hypothetical protein
VGAQACRFGFRGRANSDTPKSTHLYNNPGVSVTGRRETSPGWDAYVRASSSEEQYLDVHLGNETAELILQSNELLRPISTGRPVSSATDLDASDSNDPDDPASRDPSASGEHRASSMTGALPVDTVSQSAHSASSFIASNDTVLQREVRRLGGKVQRIERAVQLGRTLTSKTQFYSKCSSGLDIWNRRRYYTVQ